MELRHLRYFIAIAEEGSLTLAAEKRLHTAQASLSRQIRDLEREKNFLPSSVASRPIRGNAPTVDLAVGYNKANTSHLLQLFLERVNNLVAQA
jgi:hypothetical protein